MDKLILDYANAIGDNSIKFFLPSRNEALQFTKKSGDIISEILINWNLSEAIIDFPNSQKPISIQSNLAQLQKMQEQSILVPGIQINDLMLTSPILEVLHDFLENPDIRAGLVRRSDNRQIAVTRSSQSQIKTGNLKDAVKRKRSDYWHLPDLENYLRESQQALEPNNKDSRLVYSWRCHDTQFGNWREFTNEYRLIETDGIIYEVSIGLGVKSLATSPLR